MIIRKNADFSRMKSDLRMKNRDIIIIGAGAAGLVAAVAAGKARMDTGSICILEKMPRPGRKIMISGKGRCNFTNDKQWNDFSTHIHPKPNLLKNAFYEFSPKEAVGLLEKNGVECVIERGDRAFPVSHRSADVVDALERAAKAAGAEILCGKEVSDIALGKDSSFTITCTDGDLFTCKRLIVATGGLSYPTTGSTGDGYRWAEETGHIVKCRFPSLTAIVPRGYKVNSAKGHIDRSTPLSELGSSLCGIQLKNVGLKLEMDGRTVQEEFGDLDFTDGGIEGPIGFKVSRKCVNAIINGSKAACTLDLKPAVEEEDLSKRINGLWAEVCKDPRSRNRNGKDRLRVLLGKLMPVALIPAFMKTSPGLGHENLAFRLKNWKFEIDGYVGYERCVVTAGGVSADDIKAKTMESKIVEGLYFVGEVLDLDADTGGYNMQTAFSTGYLAGRSAALSL